MKRFLLKIATTLLAFLMLFSTLSFTVEKHFCGDFLVNVSYFGDAGCCDMMGMKNQTKPTVKKKKCCKDELHKISGQKELKQDFSDKISFKQQQFLAAFFTSYQNLFLINKLDTNVFKPFPPPDISFNYQVLYQTFLI